MLYIKDMNVVEILILSQCETKGKFNTFYHKKGKKKAREKIWKIQLLVKGKTG